MYAWKEAGMLVMGMLQDIRVSFIGMQNYHTTEQT